ncbi:hypothetical protein EVB55_193 [Rhizobium phage RHph_Y68]|uniref:Uncharacterized protein n=1 Tax=Rhizobium phage RHph_Y68 TaxID=2509787 RepID=A0A7S5QY51_9CAUD|nr:hypothetical protein PP934_gp193 [Rhizobium phage RHph_Y68]QIG68128.1 hypothetical protein EVB55_193 [Rhizobium phage RHph_Y68]
MAYKREYQKTPEEISESLRGTCKSLEEVLDFYEMDDAENDIEFLRDIDDKVFCCETCGWWCEISEVCDTVGHTLICLECVET